MAPDDFAPTTHVDSWPRIHPIINNAGWVLVGLGYGIAWGHQLIEHPALWGLGLMVIGGMLLLWMRAQRP